MNLEETVQQLSPAARKLILHWGEMGTKWGINRTVAQIHALLFLSPEPLNAEQIASTLQVARSNVSTSLRELQSYRIVQTTQILGDRRDYFESKKDVWEMFQIIVRERKRREVDPTREVLRECLEQFTDRALNDQETYAQERIVELLKVVETMSDLHEEFNRLPISTMRRLSRLRGQINSLLQRKGKP